MSDKEVADRVNAPAHDSLQTASGLNCAPEHSDKGIIASVLRRVIALTRRAPLPPQSGVPKTSHWVRQIRDDPAVLAQSLRAEFSIDQLLASGVLAPGAGEKPVLSPVFGDKRSKFVILRDADGAPRDAISARGILSSADPPCMQFGLSRRGEMNGGLQRVFIGTDDDELQILHSLGLRFTSSAGLEDLSSAHVTELLDSPRYYGPLARFQLVVPAWRLANLSDEVAPGTMKVLTSLAAVHRLFDHFNPSRLVGVVFLTPRAVSRLQDAAKTKNWTAVRNACLAALGETISTAPEAINFIRDREEMDYCAARRRLLQAIKHSKTVPRIAETRVAMVKLRAAWHKSVLSKFLSEEATGSPWNRVRALMGREIADKWFESQWIMTAAHSITTCQFPAPYDATEPLSPSRLKLVDTFVKLYRAGESRGRRT